MKDDKNKRRRKRELKKEREANCEVKDEKG